MFLSPTDTGKTFAGLFTVDLPTTVKKGQEFNIVVRRITTRRPQNLQEETHGMMAGIEPNKKPKKAAVVAESVVHKVRNWRYITGTFQVKIPVTTKDIMLQSEENTLAIMKWRLQHISKVNRWYPVIERYIEYISARIDGLGGHSASIKPSCMVLPASPFADVMVCTGIPVK